MTPIQPPPSPAPRPRWDRIPEDALTAGGLTARHREALAWIFVFVIGAVSVIAMLALARIVWALTERL